MIIAGPNLVAAGGFADLWSHPAQTLLAGVALITVAVGGGYALRPVGRRMRSLRHLAVAITMASLTVGAITAFVLVRLMVLDAGEARLVVGVLVLAAAFAAVLGVVASAPLGRDVSMIEATVRLVEDGDRDARSQVDRADELGHLATALDQLNARLGVLEAERRAADEERRSMLTSLGHDLRTPLAALQAAVEALADGIAPDPPRYLRSMASDVSVLSRLVDDLFLLAQIESSRLTLERVRIDLAEIADEAIEALAPTAATRAVEMQMVTEGAVIVSGDRVALGRVLRNLLDNAVRHTPAGSTVRVEVAARPSPSVRVVDEGDGFHPNFVGDAFHSFTRLDESRNRRTGGAGLGLTIAKGLIDAHGGSITIEPPPGGRVRVDLPPADSGQALPPGRQAT